MSTNRIQGRDGVIIESRKYLQIPVGSEADKPVVATPDQDVLTARKGMIRYNDDLGTGKGFEGAVEMTTLVQDPLQNNGNPIDTKVVEWQRFAMLDKEGKLTMSMLPASISGTPTYKGTWDAKTDDVNATWNSSDTGGFSERLSEIMGHKLGDYYIVRQGSGATQDHGIGHVQGVKYEVNDWTIFNGTIWERVPRAKLADVPAGQVEFESKFVRPNDTAVVEATDVNGYQFKSFGLLNATTPKNLQSVVDKLTLNALDRTGDMISGTIRFNTKGRIELTSDNIPYINVSGAARIGIGGSSNNGGVVGLVSYYGSAKQQFSLVNQQHIVSGLQILAGNPNQVLDNANKSTTGNAKKPAYAFRGAAIDNTDNANSGMYLRDGLAPVTGTQIIGFSTAGIERLTIGTYDQHGTSTSNIFTAPTLTGAPTGNPSTNTPCKPVYTFVDRKDTGMFYHKDWGDATGQLVVCTPVRTTGSLGDSISVAYEKEKTVFWKPVKVYESFEVYPNPDYNSNAGTPYQSANKIHLESVNYNVNSANTVWNNKKKILINTYDFEINVDIDTDTSYNGPEGLGKFKLEADRSVTIIAGKSSDPAGNSVTITSAKNVHIGTSTMTVVVDDNFGAIRNALQIDGSTRLRGHMDIYQTLTVGQSAGGGDTQINGNLTVGDTTNNNKTISLFGDLNVGKVGGTKTATVHANTTINGTCNINGVTVITGKTDIIGNTKVTGTFNTTGAVDLDSTLNVDALATLHSLTVSTGPTSITGDATLNNKITVTGLSTLNGGLKVVGATEVTGNTKLTGDLNVTGATDLDGTLNVDGDSTLKKTTIVGAVAITGVTNITGNTKVTGTFQSTGDATLDSKLTVTGDTSLAKLTTTGDATLGAKLSVTGDVTFSGKLAVTGDTTLVKLNTTGDVTLGAKLNVTGNTALTGTLTVTSTSTFNDNVAIAAGKFITHPATPTVANHVANKGYVDAEIARLEALITALTARVLALETP